MLIPAFMIAAHIETENFAANRIARAAENLRTSADLLNAHSLENESLAGAVIAQRTAADQLEASIYFLPDKPTVWWQLLAYAIVTAAEILVSVPALEFAYKQAPKKMKSIIMAAYLAGSISFGNVIASFVVTQLKRDSIAPYVNDDNSPNYYWVFIGLIAIASVIYMVVAKLMPTRDFVGEEAGNGSTIH